MMRATKGNSPDWYEAPDTVVTATICPLSGKLATPQCAGDAAVRPYMDYFAADHAPTEHCDRHVLHGGRGFFGGLVAAVSGRASEEAPVQATAATEASTPAPAAAPARVTRSEPPPEKKKRGFWGRVFGGRD